MPLSCAFGAAWDDAMVARWSANPGMLWPEMGAAFATLGGGRPPATAPRPVVMVAARCVRRPLGIAGQEDAIIVADGNKGRAPAVWQTARSDSRDVAYCRFG